VALTGEEIRRRLTHFAARWSAYAGSERSEAQTFLNQLFECYGQDRAAAGATFETHQGGKFLDLIWRPACIIEMKAPSEAKRLDKHRKQALDYWRESADTAKGIPAPRFVVVCAFRRLEVWEPGRYPDGPRVELDLIDLPDHYDTLLFLAGQEPVFVGSHAEVTRDAVQHIASLYEHLRERGAAGPDVLRDFILQSVWCLFAEDLGQLPAHRFTSILDRLFEDTHRSSVDDLGQLFRCLNDPSTARPTHGLCAHVPYANGRLFEDPAVVHLEADEVALLRSAADYNWKAVNPSIFGSLLEGGLGQDKQWKLGAHYTHEADIMKVVQPSIVEPWRERIENLATHAEALAAQAELMNYVVLDPACGSGNFLYVAYRELRRMEKRLAEREAELRLRAGKKAQRTGQAALSLFFPLQNIRGIELDHFAVALARVTLWMAHKLAVDELDIDESTLPLVNLSGIQTGDALRLPWPRANVIIGNPPFHGSQNLRRVLGNEYVDWLADTYKIGIKDYCVYWFRKAHDHLPAGGRAGLVGTNSVSQNRARGASLNYIVEHDGVLTSAVSTQDWPGTAAVDVSIVNWIKKPAEPAERFLLDGQEVEGINTALRESTIPLADVPPLAGNKDRAFQGPTPCGKGFIVSDDEAKALLRDARYREVVRPFLVGDDIADHPNQKPSRWVIDFGMMPLEEARKYPDALRIVEERVKPIRMTNNRESYRRYWWRFCEPRPKLRSKLAGRTRFIAGNRVGKRFFCAWIESWTLASEQTIAFTFDDDYAMGVLLSNTHLQWARAQSSTLEDRWRYTPTSAFDTFPWPPEPSTRQRSDIAAWAAKIIQRRSDLCQEETVGLTKLYNLVDDGAYADLAKLHRSLDEAVAAAYGWPKTVAHDAKQTNPRLLALNEAIRDGATHYAPFA
jgi:hypothetical protein